MMTKPTPPVDQHPTDLSNPPPSCVTSLPFAIWMVGFMMLFINTSFMMVYSLSAIYLHNILGVSPGWIGLLDTIAEGASYATKLLSGVISDYLRRRKLIVVLGYIMMVVSRPIIAISPSFGAVFTARFLERMGNGIQATPRDALVSDIAPSEKKGESFGLMRSIGIAGSFLGSIVGFLLMVWTVNNYQLIFWLATIPALIALAILIFGVKEPEQNLHPQDHKPRHPIHFADIPRLGKAYWQLMIVVSVFVLARVSETFLVLHANKNFGLAEAHAPFVMMLYNLTYCLAAYPAGRLSDRLSRYQLLSLAIAILVVADLLLCQATSLTQVLMGVLAWGLQMGMAQSIFMAMIAEMAPKDLRGTAFGFFYLISAISSVFCGIGSGLIVDGCNESTLFLVSGATAGVALLATLIVAPRGKRASAKAVV